jgi:dTDP-4-dehydrorhamnose reductase
MSSQSLVVGAAGQVGQQLLRELGPAGLPTSREERAGWHQLELSYLTTEQDAAKAVAGLEVDAIYCIGAMTHVDGCESQPELARRANALGPAALAAFAHTRGLPFVFMSTDYIFPGDNTSPGPYSEASTPRPLNVYGASKLEGEQRVLAAHPSALVLRTTVVYGEDAQAKNYLYSVVRCLSQGRHMNVPSDQVSTPSFNRDIARTAAGLVRESASGIYNVAGPELMDRLPFAQRIAAHFSLDATLLDPRPTRELSQGAARPLRSGLDISKLVAAFPHLQPHTLDQALSACEPAIGEFLHTQTT